MDEKLSLQCFAETSNEISFGNEGGQNLECIEYTTKTKVMNLGTEGLDALLYRTENSKCIPNKLINTENLTDFGLDYVSTKDNSCY